MIRIAAHNLYDINSRDWSNADIRLTGFDDQDLINAALLPVGASSNQQNGIVQFYGREFFVNRSTDPTNTLPSPYPGGIQIKTALAVKRNNVVIRGEGTDSQFILGDDQNCCVWRTMIDGPQNILFQYFSVDPNANNNQTPDSGPNWKDWIEKSSICTDTVGPTRTKNCGMEHIHFAKGAGVSSYVHGDGGFARHCYFVGSRNDVAELCHGSGGELIGCTYDPGDAADSTPYVFGTDQHSNGLISGCKVIVRKGAQITNAVFRCYGGSGIKITGCDVDLPQETIGGAQVSGRIAAITDINQAWANVNNNRFSGNNESIPGNAGMPRTKLLLDGTSTAQGNQLTYIDIDMVNSSGGRAYVINNPGLDVNIAVRPDLVASNNPVLYP